MKSIMGAEPRRLLSAFAQSRCLLAFDFDGTLAPIVSDPDGAKMRSSTNDLLAELTCRYPCIVISGRSLADVRRRVVGLGLKGIVGNHGIEPFQGTKSGERRVRNWRARFDAALRQETGVRVENKTHSLAIHVRHARAKGRARRIVGEVASKLEGVRLLGGKEVINVVPIEAPHKGMALERERARLRCDTAIYVGDDETDEDVFALDQPDRLLSIRIGRKAASHASFYLRAQPEIDRLLRELIRLRGRKCLWPTRTLPRTPCATLPRDGRGDSDT
jgi:trehalose 6-phosphate phosphatase